MRAMRVVWGVGVLSGACLLAASCSVVAGARHEVKRAEHVATAVSSAGQSHNPPRIEYLLVLNSNDKPRTSFHPGDIVGFRLEVYSVAHSLRGVKSTWQVRRGGRSMRRWSSSGGLTGPTRGNLFRMVQSEHLAQNAAVGTYSVSAMLVVQGHHLTRTTQFYVRR